MYNVEEDPKDLTEALSSVDANLWHLVDLPSDCKEIGYKWVLERHSNVMG